MISVIVPVYNVEPYLHRCVDSILAQTFTDFDLILVDDGSPDNCPTICDEYAEKDSRVHVIHQENGGLSAARNAGIDWAFANSNSQWLTFVDSDDWIHPEMLEQLLNAAVENNVAVSICGYAETKGEEPEISAEDLIPKIWSPENFFVEYNVNAIVAWGKLYQKECFEKIRYPVGKIHEDEYTTHLILFELPQIAAISAPMYNYFSNAAGIMKSQWSPKRLDAIDAKRQQIDFFWHHSFFAAYERDVLALCWSIAAQIMKIEKEPGCPNAGYLKNLRKQLRKELYIHRGLPSLAFHKNYGLFETAYPQFMKMYWLGQVILRKMHLRE